MFFLALIFGFAVSILAWFIASRYAAMFILSIGRQKHEHNDPKSARIAEAIICGALFLGCIAFAFWIANALTR